jgi:hypothetical protein
MNTLVESYIGDELPPLDGINVPKINNKDIAVKNLRQLFNQWIEETGKCTKSEQILITEFIDWIDQK